MKHSMRITLWLVFFFILAQIIGLLVVAEYVNVEQIEALDLATNQTYLINETVPVALPLDMERPEFQQSSSFIIYLIIAIIIATVLFLLLVKLKTVLIWKLWFLAAVFLCLTVAFDAFVTSSVALFTASLFAIWKIFKPSVLIHNFTELFIYGGLAAILVPIQIVTPGTIIILLLLVSLYDMYAVWKSKHMVKMAQFQAESKVFAGLLVPYKKTKVEAKMPKKGKVEFRGVKTAVLGGGDVVFPLLLSGAVLKVSLTEGPFNVIFLKTLLIPLATAVALYLLFVKGKEDKFYPALPFLTTGCLIGYGLFLLL